VARIALEVELHQIAVRPPGCVADEPGLADLARTSEDEGASLPCSQPGEEVLCLAGSEERPGRPVVSGRTG
jgi:hypothetical protein